ncbi:MAG TPA: cytochrome c-type biogenesis protein CcmH [Thermoleophilaceae bacterium]|nr:cytochrome c-type biogenesis protein CcmH [Thermoleophilaceae bacterium]
MKRVALVAMLAVLALPAAATAADCPKTTLSAVEAEVMCPVCGTPLALATEAPQANRERALIQRLVDRCRSKEEIKAVLVAEYGDGVLALPEADGFNLSAYLVPALAVLVGLVGVGFAARRWRRGGGRPADGSLATAGRAGGSDAAAKKRLDADLERYDL